MLIMVTPGASEKGVSDWEDSKGNPKRFDVQFVNGVAVVDQKLGEWMIRHGLANRSGLIHVTRKLIRAA